MTVLWRNWAGTQRCWPARVERPSSVDELRSAVAAATDADRRVKVVGSAHSFTGIAATDGVLVRLDSLAEVVRVERDSGLVTVESGMPLYRLNQVLAAHGLALPNLGDIDRQTIAGSISTGTHGTGARMPGLAAQVRKLELVLPDGGLVVCSTDHRRDLFAAARVGLGALGVIARVTLQCVPAFALHAVEGPMPLAAVLADLDTLVSANDHFEFYWFPHTGLTLTKRNNRWNGERIRPVGPVAGWWEDEFLSNTMFGWANRLGRAVPASAPLVNAVSARALSARDYSDVSHRVFTSPRRVVFAETEWALPRSAVRDVLLDLRRLVRRERVATTFPVEVRFAAPDDAWLSMAHGRDTAYVAVHQFEGMPYRDYFDAVGRIAAAAGGRPHWGKLHRLDAEALADRYPRFGDFLEQRRTVDPTGVFANPYLDRVLGPV